MVFVGVYPNNAEQQPNFFADVRGGAVKVPFMHKAEKIIHLILSDIAYYGIPNDDELTQAIDTLGRPPQAKDAPEAISGTLCECESSFDRHTGARS